MCIRDSDPSLVVATGNDNSAYPKLSADGTKVVFFSLASDLVSGDFNNSWDVFVKDLSTGIITCASTSSTGIQGNSHSFDPVLSADGTKVIFYSHSSNLVPGDTNNRADVFIKYLLGNCVSVLGAECHHSSRERKHSRFLHYSAIWGLCFSSAIYLG